MPIVKLLDMRHANLGDRFASIMAYDFLGNLGIPVCGGDLDELHAINDKTDPCTHLLVWGGGTIYETEKGTDGPLNTWGLLEKSRRMKTLFVGPGFNGISTEDPQIIEGWKEVLDNASLVSLRDRESIEECQKKFNIVLDSRYHHYPEISFVCKKYIDPKAPKINNLAAYSTTVPYFKLEDQVKIINAIRKNKMRIMFFSHSDDDRKFYIENNLLIPTDSLIDLRESPIAALQLLAMAKIHVTSRLHGMIMSIIAGVPFVHINANMSKVFWQLEEINLPKYPYAFENPNKGLLGNYPVVSFDALGDIISKLIRDNSIRNQLLEVSEHAAVAANKHLELTQEILLGE